MEDHAERPTSRPSVRQSLTPLTRVLTGFLPCGLVYAFLAIAVQTGSVVMGAVTMLAFGLGTMVAPVLSRFGMCCRPIDIVSSNSLSGKK